MKAIRIVLSQKMAHYKKEETVTNKMTYPLPPFSTVIGAIHNACGYKNYHKMNISIQGNFESLNREAYTDHCFLNSVMDDRGILVKRVNSNLQSTAFIKVAQALKSTGNSFRKGETIQVFNQKLMDEYLKLKNINDEIEIFKNNRIKKVEEVIRKRAKNLKEKKKKFDKKSEEYKKLDLREKELKNLKNIIKERFDTYKYENYEKEISKYASLTTSIKYYEVLYGVNLVIHIQSDDDTLRDIKENIYNLKAIGRSEDFVDIKECEYVELIDNFEEGFEFTSKNSAYINYDLVKNNSIFFEKQKKGIPANGTRYKINKVYDNSTGKRIFSKIDVLYTSNYCIDDESKEVFFDKEGKYIVNFN